MSYYYIKHTSKQQGIWTVLSEAKGGFAVSAAAKTGITIARFFNLLARVVLGPQNKNKDSNLQQQHLLKSVLNQRTLLFLGSMVLFTGYAFQPAIQIAQYPPATQPESLKFFFIGVLGLTSSIGVARLGLFISISALLMFTWMVVRQSAPRMALFTVAEKVKNIKDDSYNQDLWNTILNICSLAVVIVYTALTAWYVFFTKDHNDEWVEYFFSAGWIIGPWVVIGLGALSTLIDDNSIFFRIICFLLLPVVLPGIVGLLAICMVVYILYNIACIVAVCFKLVSKLHKERKLAQLFLFIGTPLYCIAGAIGTGLAGSIVNSWGFSRGMIITSVCSFFLLILIFSEIIFRRLTLFAVR